jgi:hypothetical protein
MMRKNQYDETMRIKEIRLQPNDAKQPDNGWSVEILWVYEHERSGELYGMEIERIDVAEAVRRGVMTRDEHATVFSILGRVADEYHKSGAVSDEQTLFQ